MTLEEIVGMHSRTMERMEGDGVIGAGRGSLIGLRRSSSERCAEST